MKSAKVIISKKKSDNSEKLKNSENSENYKNSEKLKNSEKISKLFLGFIGKIRTVLKILKF